MDRFWNSDGQVTAWTAHDGPTLGNALPRRGWSVGLAAAWIGVFVPIIAIGCPCVENGTCTEPMWVSVFGSLFFLALVPALVGLVRTRPWAGWFSAAAAGLGIPLAFWELGHAPGLGLFQLGSFGILLVWSLWLAVLIRGRLQTIRRALAAASAPVAGIDGSFDTTEPPASTARDDTESVVRQDV